MSAQPETWLALNLVQRLGPRTVEALLNHFGHPEALRQATPEALRRDCGLPAKLSEQIAGCFETPAFQKECSLVQQHGVRVIPLDDPDYPTRLREINFPPLVLYCRGQLPPGDGAALAIVGTRTMTRYGEQVTRRVIEDLALARANVTIISGLARGIDAVAHEQALESGLPTVAVLGGGLTRIYPRQNQELAERIANSHALISQFAMPSRPLAHHFPIRNRTISGMADAVLVVEAGDKSGALITAGFASNYGRPVLAVPGNVDRPNSQGTNRLINDGNARLVRDGADVLAAMCPARFGSPTQLDWLEAREPDPPSAKAILEGDKGRIIAALAKGPLHPDDLAGELSLPIEKLIGLLLELELSGDILQTSDNQYALS